MKDYKAELEQKIICEFSAFVDTYGFHNSLKLLETLQLQREAIIRMKTLRAAVQQ